MTEAELPVYFHEQRTRMLSIHRLVYTTLVLLTWIPNEINFAVLSIIYILNLEG